MIWRTPVFLLLLSAFLSSVNMSAAEDKTAERQARNAELMVIDDAATLAVIKREAEALRGKRDTVKPETLQKQLNRAQDSKARHTPKGLLKSDLFADSPHQLFARSGKSVLVIVHATDCGKCDELHLSTASGFVISSTGVAVTNFHVMDDADGELVLAINRDMEVFPVTAVLAADRDADCALIQLGDGKRNDFTPVPLADYARIGEPVTVISHPDDHFFVLTRGVAARYAYTDCSGELPWLYITAEYAKGSSGAPVFNDKGQVVGLVSSTRSIYYTETEKRQKDLQMVLRLCVPVPAIHQLMRPPEKRK